jgi:hypothetical protein
MTTENTPEERHLLLQNKKKKSVAPTMSVVWVMFQKGRRSRTEGR